MALQLSRFTPAPQTPSASGARRRPRAVFTLPVLLLGLLLGVPAAGAAANLPDLGQRVLERPSLAPTPISGSWSKVESAGGVPSHYCGLHVDGTVACWGWNYRGQATAPIGAYLDVSTGDEFSCAVRSDGGLVCWGNSSLGRTAAPSGTFTRVSAGQKHACALRSSGVVACWGLTGGSTPSGTFQSVVALHSGRSCGVRTNGTPLCWGTGGLRVGSAAAGTFVATDDGCGIRTDGTLACWDPNAKIGDQPASIGLPAGQFESWSRDCGIRTDHVVECRGGSSPVPSGKALLSFSGQCGVLVDHTLECWNEGLFAAGLPLPPSTGFASALATSAGMCGLRSDGSLQCIGQLGNDIAPPGAFASIGSGNGGFCGVRTDGTVACWGGLNWTLPTTQYRSADVGIDHVCGILEDWTLGCDQTTPPAGTFTSVSVGLSWDRFACAISIAATISCWGANGHGQANPPSGTFTALSAGSDFVCGIRTNGALACWGGSTESTPGITSAPQGVFTAVAVGVQFACALRVDGRVVCWGPGPATWRINVTPVGTFTSLNAGDASVCAMRSDGVFQCWGELAALSPTLADAAAAAPSGVPANSRVSLSWTRRAWPEVRSVSDWVVQRSANGGAWRTVPHRRSSKPSLGVGGLRNGVSYRFRVAPRSGSRRGQWFVSEPVVPRTTPGRPRNVRVVAGPASLTVDWDAPTSDGGSAVLQYRVQSSTDGANWSTVTVSADSRNAVLSGLPQGVQHRVRVIAINAAGAGKSAEVKGVVPTAST